MSAVDDEEAQVQWGKLVLPEYRRMRQRGPEHLDTFLCGLFFAYGSRFQPTLLAKLGPLATMGEGTVTWWRHDVLTMLSSLLLRLHLSEPLTQAPSSTSTSSTNASRSNLPADSSGTGIGESAAAPPVTRRTT